MCYGAKHSFTHSHQSHKKNNQKKKKATTVKTFQVHLPWATLEKWQIHNCKHVHHWNVMYIHCFSFGLSHAWSPVWTVDIVFVLFLLYELWILFCPLSPEGLCNCYLLTCSFLFWWSLLNMFVMVILVCFACDAYSEFSSVFFPGFAWSLPYYTEYDKKGNFINYMYRCKMKQVQVIK